MYNKFGALTSRSNEFRVDLNKTVDYNKKGLRLGLYLCLLVAEKNPGSGQNEICCFFPK